MAEVLGCTAAKISRLETGIVRVQPEDASNLLDVYDVSADRRREFLALLHESHRREWWHSYVDVVPPAAGKFYSLEAAATGVQDYSHGLLPGLLQTEQYARALIGSGDEKSKVVDRRVELRMRRQELLTTDGAPVCTFLIGESALRTRVGSRQVMIGQFERLLDVGTRSNVTIRIVPSIVHPATGVSFIILHFTPAEHPSVTFIEALTRNIFVEELREVRVYAETFKAVESISLSVEDSRRLLGGPAR